MEIVGAPMISPSLQQLRSSARRSDGEIADLGWRWQVSPIGP